jgi:hypothetical protein
MLSIFAFLITDSNGLIILFIPATNFDDTNLVMVNICSLLGSMCHAFHDRNNMFESCYIPL